MDKPSVSIASKTDKGRRPANEDSFLVVSEQELGGEFDCLLIVADGMGGRASGAVASDMAVTAVRDTFAHRTPGSAPEDLLARSLEAANSAVYSEAQRKPELNGMGTTCVVAVIRGDRAWFGHLGDSRAYLLRDGRLLRLTEDHSFVAEKVKSGEITDEQARRSRFRNVITRAVGLESEAEPETGSTDLRPGDVLLLCTDGLTTPVPDSQIADILCTSSDVEEACDHLTKQALKNGGSDNITIILAAYGRARKPVTREPAVAAVRKRSWVFPAIIGLLLGLGLGIGTLFTPLRTHILDLVPPKPPVKVEQPKEPDVANLEYGEPLLLLSHVPVQGRMLVLDPRGYLYVADRQGKLIRLDASGQVLHEFPAREELKQTISSRSPGIATDSQGNLYIADTTGKQIKKFGADGIFITSIAKGVLSAPEAIAVDKNGAVFVIDAGRLKVIHPIPVDEPAPVDVR